MGQILSINVAFHIYPSHNYVFCR